MAGPRWGLIGFGEVGSTLARHLVGQQPGSVAVTDPLLNQDHVPEHVQRRLEGLDLRVVRSITELSRCSDLVLSTVTARVAVDVAGQAGPHLREGIYIDVNSLSPMHKREAAASFAENRYVDGAILGAIAAQGARTPVALSGPRAPQACTLLKEAGFDVEVVGDQVGAASALKLCRSIFMKGIECLLVETLLAARRFNLIEQVYRTIEDSLDTYGFQPMARMLVTSHAIHCGRRAHEMDGVVQMLQQMNLPHAMSAAAGTVLNRTDQAGLPGHFRQIVPEAIDQVLDQLDAGPREKT